MYVMCMYIYIYIYAGGPAAAGGDRALLAREARGAPLLAGRLV